MSVDLVSSSVPFRLTALALRYGRLVPPCKIPTRVATIGFCAFQLTLPANATQRAEQLSTMGISAIYLFDRRLADILGAIHDLTLDVSRALRLDPFTLIRIPRSVALCVAVHRQTWNTICVAEVLRIAADASIGVRELTRRRHIEGFGRLGLALTRGYLMQNFLDP